MAVEGEAPDTMAIGLGANLGDPLAQLTAARTALREVLAPMGWQLWRVSSAYRTAPWQADGPSYVNAVTLWRGRAVDPHGVLVQLQALEGAAGRTRPYRYAPRTLDLDLLWCGRQSLTTEVLCLPHPRLWERAFVVLPLAEVLATEVDMSPHHWGGPRAGWAAAVAATAGQPIERMRESSWDS